MQIEVKNLSKSEVEITGEILAIDFDAFIKKSILNLSKDMELPGFRKGHIPQKIVLEKAGEDYVLQKAAEVAMQEAYPKIIKEENIEVIGRPDIVITKLARGNNLGFKIKTAILPDITLPDYKEIAQKTPKDGEQKVEENEVSIALENLLKSRASSLTAEAQKTKDVAEATVGKPELNDEFAKSVGKFNNLKELKDAVKKNIQFEKEMKAKEKRRVAILEQIAQKTEVEIPKIMIEAEKEKMASELKSNVENMGLKWEDYLKNIKKEESELKAGWDDDAKKRVKYGLILREINNKEKIEVTNEDVNGYLDKLLSGYPQDKKPSEIEKKQIKDYAKGVLQNEKIFQFLEDQKISDN